ncbi:hypothetical protein ACSQ96_22630, partial [Salmonella enterica]|uniref:hypothetical protein n=1 Tax=Salmonella enterica TaxID=28901 RepID=UPI003EDC634A
KALEALKAQKGPIDPAALERAQKRFDASQHAENMGITSIPGYVRYMVSRDPDKGVINTLRASVREQLHGSSPG